MQERIRRTKALLNSELNKSEPYERLAHILDSVLELVKLPDNEFCWSCWDTEEEASREINKLLKIVHGKIASRGINKVYKVVRLIGIPRLPLKFKLDFLFMGTGDLQEVSIASGWADLFLNVAKEYDQVTELLWEDK